MSNKKCEIEDCPLNIFNGRSQCVLHCGKSDYSKDYRSIGILSNFYDELINYIVSQIGKHHFSISINSSIIKDYLSGNESLVSSQQILKIEEYLTDVIFDQIYFPARKPQDKFDYLKILRKLKGIHFNNCQFQAHSLSLPHTKVFFQDCQFHAWWSSDLFQVLGNVNNVIYQDCIFDNDVDFSSEFNQQDVDKVSSSLFNDCQFKGSLSLKNLNLSHRLFNNSKDQIPHSIPEFNIVNCTINSRFTLENCKIETFSIRNTHFNERFKGKNNTIRELMINNCNFKKLFDIHGSNLTNFRVEQTIFEDFAGFEECTFSQNSNNEPANIAIFNYVTFFSFTNFRNTVFHQGLNIENINFKDTPNFLNIQLKSNRSNRETFRIIKYSFDKIGNHIEANKFYAKEMEKYHKSLKNKSFWSQNKLIFGINKLVSNFGQSYLRPIGLILLISILYYLVQYGHEKNWLYSLHPKLNPFISCLASLLNSIAKNIIPLSKFLDQGMEFISLIFYIIFTSLIWQTVVAIKRHTKR